MDSVFYAELTPAAFRRRLNAAPIAYLPLGTLEWHGEHLPLGADGLQSSGFFSALAGEVGGIVLPMLFLGPDLHQAQGGKDFYGMDILGFKDRDPGQLTGSAYWVGEEFFEWLLLGILKQLKRAGFRIVVAHGHGPSTKYFQQKIAAWEPLLDLRLCTCFRDKEDIYGIQTDHAAANETSLMMALRPDLVHMENLDPDPGAWPLAVGGQDPRRFASAGLGSQALAQQKERMADLLLALLRETA
jgi:creatinine amidohydrolase